jgi:hypothetical protein
MIGFEKMISSPRIIHAFCSRNGLDEMQAMDLSAALHKVSHSFKLC